MATRAGFQNKKRSMWNIINYRDLILEYSSVVLLTRELFEATREHRERV